MRTDRTANALFTGRASYRGWTSKQFDESITRLVDRKITRIRQIHDTAAVRATGFTQGA